MNDREKNNNAPRSLVAMWGTRQQLCNQGNVMVAGTVMSSAAVEALSGELLPKVTDVDTDQTKQIDRRILGELECSGLRQQVQIAVRANPQLDLPSKPNLEDMIRKSELLTALATGRKPELAEELAISIKTACHEAGRNVCRQFDLAAANAPSKVESILKDLIDALALMDHPKGSDGHALARFQKRANQFKTVARLKGQIKETAYEKLMSHLAQEAQSEYSDVLEQWTNGHFREYWEKQCDTVRERCERFLQDSRAYRSKVRLCVEECTKRFNRANERLTTLKSGSQVVLQEASEAEFLAALMANRKVGGQSELIEDLRHDFEERLRQRAEQTGMGQHNARQMPFRALVLALSVTDIVDTFVSLIVEGTSDSHSFYDSCQAYGLGRLVSDLVRRSRITSWFDGRNNSRFGITQFEVRMVRMPKATNPKEAEIKELLKAFFAREGFHDVLNSSHARSICVLRIFAGWPIGIEGGNPALLEDYKKSADSGHLPHLVGILPDTQAGEHAPGLMRL
jgi:hypothetical protein